MPALPPARELESRAVLKACIEARAALAELKQAAALIPNQAMLINTIPLLEAKDSSEIENIVTTTDQLFQYAQSPAQGQDNADPATKEALRYRTALHRGYLSRHVIAHKADYYGLLLGVTRDQAWEPWLQFMLQAVAETSKWTTGKIAAIRKLAEHTTEHVRARLPKIYTRELVDVIFEQPYCRIGNLVDKGIAQRQAASRYLHDLADLGVLREMPFGREKLFIHPKLMQLLSRDNNQFQPYT
ncbi:MAG: hypothetical protein KGI67_09330 [Pseudomonadota bacterium]|nr:hypothetical protein [Pseudomonadota bacterium]